MQYMPFPAYGGPVWLRIGKRTKNEANFARKGGREETPLNAMVRPSLPSTHAFSLSRFRVCAGSIAICASASGTHAL